MIVWVNGTFGVGKTTTAAAIGDQTDWRMFDPEHVGYLLAHNLKDFEFDDFQDLAPWRTLVPLVADEIHRFTASSVTMAVQSVLSEEYWNQLSDGFRRRSTPVMHVVLDCDEGELRRRIEADEIEHEALQWRLDHIPRFRQARPWLMASADLVVDTTDLDPTEVAARIVDAQARHPAAHSST